MKVQPILSFSDEDKVGMPYDDALVVTLRICGYDVKRVLVAKYGGQVCKRKYKNT